jgi:hypothetical protein
MASGGRGRGRGGRDKDRDQKPLTKEALDADLDEVREEVVWHFPWVFRISIEVYITFLMAFFSHDFCFSVQFGTLSSSVWAIELAVANERQEAWRNVSGCRIGRLLEGQRRWWSHW